jgi:uncharacterized protein (TIGR02646 family)
MRPIVKTIKENRDGSPLTFRHWKAAKNLLLAELGNYCSFCEREGYKSSLDVEHILPKGIDKYDHLRNRWDNFLLACKNCNSIKGSKDFDSNETYLPHQDNLLTTIEILDGGTIRIKQNLSNEEERKTKNFIALVGIDRDPSHPLYSDKDDRWNSRMKIWDIANGFLSDYQNNNIRLERIIQTAGFSGFWSIWFTVFREFPEVKREFISRFPGTDEACFDEQYQPLQRPPARI